MILFTALGLGLIAYQAVQPHRSTAGQLEAPKPLTMTVLTASRTLQAGTLIRDDDLQPKAITTANVGPSALQDTAEVRASLRGALLRRYIEPGSPVQAEDVLRPRDRGFVAAVLAPGARAVSIGVDSITGVGGLIWPGDRVDVILTQELGEGNASVGRRVVSETVMADVRVVAVDQSITQGAQAGGDAGPGKAPRTVTLELTQEQAERTVVAQHLGRLALTIRAAEGANDPLANRNSTFGEDVSPALAGSTPMVASRLRIIQGDKTEDVRFK